MHDKPCILEAMVHIWLCSCVCMVFSWFFLGTLTKVCVLTLLCIVCLLQSIEHLRWDRDRVRKVFSYEVLDNKASGWLGQQQLDDVRSKVDVR